MASLIQLVKSKKQISLFFSAFTGISPAGALSEGEFFTTFLTVASKRRWKENFLFNLNLCLVLIILGWMEKRLIVFCILILEIFDWRGQSSSSGESVNDSKYELEVFTIFMFLVKISPFSFKAIFESPNKCLLQKLCLQLYQKSFEPRKGFKLLKYSWLNCLFNLTK